MLKCKENSGNHRLSREKVVNLQVQKIGQYEICRSNTENKGGRKQKPKKIILSSLYLIKQADYEPLSPEDVIV